MNETHFIRLKLKLVVIVIVGRLIGHGTVELFVVELLVVTNNVSTIIGCWIKPDGLSLLD